MLTRVRALESTCEGHKENMRAEELTVEQIIDLIEATRIASQSSPPVES